MQLGASGRRAETNGVVGTQAGQPSPVGLAPLFGPRHPSSSGKPLIRLQVHAPKFIVQRPYEPLRKMHASLSSLKNPRKFVTILVLPYTFLCIFLPLRNPRVSCEFVQQSMMKKALYFRVPANHGKGMPRKENIIIV
jgi:hypothetical protein